MAANGAPGVLSPLVVLTEVGGTIAIIPGWKTRIASILLARLSLLAALLFHHNFADRRPGPDTHVPKGLFHRGSIPDPRRADRDDSAWTHVYWHDRLMRVRERSCRIGSLPAITEGIGYALALPLITHLITS
jgi:hypothetical protein